MWSQICNGPTELLYEEGRHKMCMGFQPLNLQKCAELETTTPSRLCESLHSLHNGYFLPRYCLKKEPTALRGFMEITFYLTQDKSGPLIYDMPSKVRKGPTNFYI